MKPAKAYYSLIQYCPDLGRHEAANVGVLLFCPEAGFLQAKVAPNNRRIIHFFAAAGHDWQRINALKQGLADRLAVEAPDIQTLEHLERFISQRANLPNHAAAADESDRSPKRPCDALYADLIGETLAKGSTKGLQRVIGERFTAAGLDPKIQRGIKVTVPVCKRKSKSPSASKTAASISSTPSLRCRIT